MDVLPCLQRLDRLLQACTQARLASSSLVFELCSHSIFYESFQGHPPSSKEIEGGRLAIGPSFTHLFVAPSPGCFRPNVCLREPKLLMCVNPTPLGDDGKNDAKLTTHDAKLMLN